MLLLQTTYLYFMYLFYSIVTSWIFMYSAPCNDFPILPSTLPINITPPIRYSRPTVVDHSRWPLPVCLRSSHYPIGPKPHESPPKMTDKTRLPNRSEACWTGAKKEIENRKSHLRYIMRDESSNQFPKKGK